MSLSLYLCLLHVLFYIYLVLLLAIVYHDFGILQKLQLQGMFSIFLFCFLSFTFILFFPCYCVSWFWQSAEGVAVGYVCVVGFFISSAMCIVARVWSGLDGFVFSMGCFGIHRFNWCACLCIRVIACIGSQGSSIARDGISWKQLVAFLIIVFFIILQCCETLFATELMCTEVRCMQY